MELNDIRAKNWTPRVALSRSAERADRSFTDAVTALTFLKQIVPELPSVGRYGRTLLGSLAPRSRGRIRAAVSRSPTTCSPVSAWPSASRGEKPQDALAELASLPKSFEKIGDYHLVVGRAQLALGDTDRRSRRARRPCASRRIRASLRPDRHRVRGTGQLTAAQDAYAKAIEADRSNAGRVALGDIYGKARKPDEALKSTTRADARPRDSQPGREGRHPVQQDRLDEAIRRRRPP